MPPGFTFDGVHSDEYGVYLAAKPMDLVSQSRAAEFTIPGRAGRLVARTEADVRVVKLQIDYTNKDGQAALGTSITTNLEAFAALLDPEKGDRELIFDDRPGRRLLARVEGESEIVRQVLHGTGEITMRAVDPPYWLGDPKTVHWEPNSGQSTTITNLGNKATPFQFSITPKAPSSGGVGGLTDFRLTVAGKLFRWTGTLAMGAILEVDTGEFTAARSTGVNEVDKVDLSTGTFPKLEPGANLVQFSSSLNSGAVLDVDYTERFT